MITSTLIDRTQIRHSQDISIEEFNSLCLDYRQVGDFQAQLAALSKDYESVGWRAMYTGQRLHVDQSYQDYMVLIRSRYSIIP